MTWRELKLFQDARHQPFTWVGGRPAALLVHGFPGTPAEMRPLATLLQPMGWTVQGLLLPGFGPAFATLGSRRWEEWQGAIVEALDRLRVAGHRPLLLAGFSMGGALAISAAAVRPSDGLVLLAPFTWQSGPAQVFAGSLLRPVMPRSFRPFVRANFGDPRTRNLVLTMMPGLDLDDPEIQQAIRRLEVTTSLVEQLLRAGWQAWRNAPRASMPTLVVQGRQDQTVPAARTRRLVGLLPHVTRYLELDAGHQLIGEANLAWPTVQEAVMDFAARLEEGQWP